MSASWTNKNAILRDLSYAQGLCVPVEIENAVYVDDKPPALNVTEETEEPFYRDCIGEGDFNTGPDLPLIQQMLQKVKATEIEATEEDVDVQTCTLLEDSNYNGTDDNVLLEEPKSPYKPKRDRNVAMSSLRDAVGNGSIDEMVGFYKPNNKLLKPSDFECNLEHTSARNRASNRSAKRIPIMSPESMFRSKPKIELEPSSMFKAKPKFELEQESMFKAKPKLEEQSMFKKKDTVNNEEITSPNKSKSRNTKMYVPSSHAGEYYQKYLEKSKAKEAAELAKEDIWKKAERKMQEIDLKRKQEKTETTEITEDGENSTSINQNSTSLNHENGQTLTNQEINISAQVDKEQKRSGCVIAHVASQVDESTEEKGIAQVVLPQHRHHMSEECVVCDVLCVKKDTVKENDSSAS